MYRPDRTIHRSSCWWCQGRGGQDGREQRQRRVRRRRPGRAWSMESQRRQFARQNSQQGPPWPEYEEVADPLPRKGRKNSSNRKLHLYTTRIAKIAWAQQQRGRPVAWPASKCKQETSNLVVTSRAFDR